MSDDPMLDELGRALDRPVPPAPADRVAALRAEVEAARAAATRSHADVEEHPAGGVSRRTWIVSSAAAAVGAIGGAVVATAVQDDGTPASPPTEAMSWTVDGAVAGEGVAVTGRTINHTWGVEVILEGTGFAVPAAYRVMYLGPGGTRTDAGGFLGAVKPMVCRCNAPVLRADIDTMEILDDGGRVVARGTFA